MKKYIFITITIGTLFIPISMLFLKLLTAQDFIHANPNGYILVSFVLLFVTYIFLKKIVLKRFYPQDPTKLKFIIKSLIVLLFVATTFVLNISFDVLYLVNINSLNEDINQIKIIHLFIVQYLVSFSIYLIFFILYLFTQLNSIPKEKTDE